MPQSAGNLAPLQVVEAAGGIIFFGLLIWEHFQPDGPKDFLLNLRDDVQEFIQYHRAMTRTLEEIEELPLREEPT